MSMSFNDWAEKISHWRQMKGFYTPDNIDNTSDRDLMLGKLMLVVSELAEAAEAVRKANLANFKEEIADTFIRLLDICGTMKIDIEDEIRKKMAINEGRPYRHNTKVSL